jgi:Mn-dependent DtxR family transcriptional regulator
MDKEERYTLEILNRIEENGRVTQPEIASHLGISLGLANSFIKRIARKGYIKLTTIPRDRAKYLLTPQGIAAKSRLTIKYLQYSLNFYKKAKDTIARAYAQLEKEGAKNVVFYGVGEIAEIAYILLQQNQMQLSGVIDEQKAGKIFLKHRVGAIGDLKSLSFDKVIVTEFESPDKIIVQLKTAAIPEHKIFILKDATIPQSSAGYPIEQSKGYCQKFYEK